MSVTSATDSWQDLVRHVRMYLRKKSPRKGHDLMTASVTGWESQILWVQLTGHRARGQGTTYLSHIKPQQATTYSESTGLFLSSVGTDRHLQRPLLPWEGRNHLWQFFLLSTDFGESLSDKLWLAVGF